jgi:hypothetical protein
MNRLKIKLLITVFAVLVGSGCATHTVKWVDAKPVDSYSIHTKMEGISLAADPYDNPDKAKEGFYVDVCSKGFYPVHLILRNGTDNRLIILRDSIELIDAEGKTYKPVRSNVMSNVCQHNIATHVILGFGGYSAADQANRIMESDWRDKEISETVIILPGGKTNGFVYFQLPIGKTTKGSKLSLESEKMESKQKIKLELDL